MLKPKEVAIQGVVMTPLFERLSAPAQATDAISGRAPAVC